METFTVLLYTAKDSNDKCNMIKALSNNEIFTGTNTKLRNNRTPHHFIQPDSVFMSHTVEKFGWIGNALYGQIVILSTSIGEELKSSLLSEGGNVLWSPHMICVLGENIPPEIYRVIGFDWHHGADYNANRNIITVTNHHKTSIRVI